MTKLGGQRTQRTHERVEYSKTNTAQQLSAFAARLPACLNTDAAPEASNALDAQQFNG
jgi:hypothetical protein